jgi:hypothetical protein
MTGPVTKVPGALGKLPLILIFFSPKRAYRIFQLFATSYLFVLGDVLLQPAGYGKFLFERECQESPPLSDIRTR